jgi:hypothetical protein
MVIGADLVLEGSVLSLLIIGHYGSQGQAFLAQFYLSLVGYKVHFNSQNSSLKRWFTSYSTPSVINIRKLKTNFAASQSTFS